MEPVERDLVEEEELEGYLMKDLFLFTEEF